MTQFFFLIRSILLEKKWYMRPIWPLLHFCYRAIMFSYGSSISLRTTLKGVPILVHGLHGIFISSRAIVGRNVTIYQQVTIGSIAKGSKSGAPIIEDGVVIGPGVKILGSLRVGVGARIAANCVVVDDVPDYAFVFMDRPRIIPGNAGPDK